MISTIVIVLLSFLIIYFPPLVGINTLHIVGVLSWIGIIHYNKNIQTTLKINKVISLFNYIALFMVYLLFIAVFNSTSSSIVSRMLFWAIDVIPACILISHICLKKKYQLIDMLKLLLIVGNIQGLIALITFIFPPVQSLIIERMVSLGFRDIFLQLAEHRMYGWSSSLTFSTPIAQGMFAVIAVYLSINKSMKYLLFTPLLLFSAVINARSSLVIILIGLLLIFLVALKLRKIKSFYRLFIIGAITTVLVLVMFQIIKTSAPQTYEWIVEGGQEITYFLRGDNVGYFTYVTDSTKYTMPTGTGFWFGEGVSNISEYHSSLQSDVGWTNDMWLGGLFYSVLIGLFFVRKLYQIQLQRNDEDLKSLQLNKFIAYFIFAVFITGNFKGIMFSINEVVTLVFLFYVFIVCRKDDNLVVR
ncbi:hypothetical protein FHS18_002625 [Paenibacillus phyllosphaerae]|uniref:Uncharacterized protein n=1 Tax=Paenibacillus phyllosphaerae TaxID=274593 RepID=A0A7W5AXH4_9BACL|nr:hypothetical protein [Paenibacillus phyllosphaerae]MBB3110558.1 hypothetical protein [Paenibacillus phyllosphaerae]